MRDTQRMALIGGVAAVVVGADRLRRLRPRRRRRKGGGKGSVASADGKAPRKVETGPPSAAEVRTTAKRVPRPRGPRATREDGRPAHRRQPARPPTALNASSNERPHLARSSTGRRSRRRREGAVHTSPPRSRYRQQSSTWSYDSALEVVRDKKTGDAGRRLEAVGAVPEAQGRPDHEDRRGGHPADQGRRPQRRAAVQARSTRPRRASSTTCASGTATRRTARPASRPASSTPRARTPAPRCARSPRAPRARSRRRSTRTCRRPPSRP